MKYPIGTTIRSKNDPNLKGIIVRHDGRTNVVEWSDPHRKPWRNGWYDENFDGDYDKTLTKPLLEDDLFTL